MALGASLGLAVTGEGIEDREQLRRLQDEHCDYGHGFLFAPPLEPDAVGELARAAEGAAA